MALISLALIERKGGEGGKGCAGGGAPACTSEARKVGVPPAHQARRSRDGLALAAEGGAAHLGLVVIHLGS